MEKELIFAFISILIYTIGIVPYFRDIITGRTIPHPFSFGVWAVANFFNSFVLLGDGQYFAFFPSIIMSCVSGISLVIGIFHIRKIHINWFDWLCLILSVSLLIYYFTTRNLLGTILFSITIDFIALLPTVKKGWIRPWSESALMYICSGVNQIFTLLAMPNASPESRFFWFYVFISNGIYSAILLSRRYSLKGWKSIFE